MQNADEFLLDKFVGVWYNGKFDAPPSLARRKKKGGQNAPFISLHHFQILFLNFAKFV